MNKPTFYPGIQATCEDCQHFACTGYQSYYCTHKGRDAGPYDTICECYIDRRTGQMLNHLTNDYDRTR